MTIGQGVKVMKSTLQIFTPTMHQESGRMNTRLERNHINLVHYLSIKLSQKIYHQYHHFLYPLSFSKANKRLIAKYEEEGDSVGPLEVFLSPSFLSPEVGICSWCSKPELIVTMIIYMKVITMILINMTTTMIITNLRHTSRLRLGVSAKALAKF